MKKYALVLASFFTILVLPFVHAEWADAVYRDGAVGGLDYHAALIYRFNNATSTTYVIHSAGTGFNPNSVRIGDWNEFLNGNTYMGRRCKGNPSYNIRDTIIDEALDQLNAHYWVQNPWAKWNEPNSSPQSGDGYFRCDGLVEYCYEQAGIDPCANNTTLYWGGPDYQFGQLSAAIQTRPYAIMSYPSSENPQYPTVSGSSQVTLQAGANDTHSGLSYSSPFTYKYARWISGAWTDWTTLGNFGSSVDFNLSSPNTVYAWYVIAYDNDGLSERSGFYYIKYVPKPSPPTGVSASDGTYTDKIRVTWNSQSDATSYEVWRHTSNSPNSASRIANNVISTTYDDKTATTGQTYYYWVTAKNDGGTSGPSGSNSGYRQVSAPSAPTGVSASDDSYTDKVRVTWNSESGATAYEVWRHTSNNSGSASRIADNVTSTTYDDKSANAGQTYYYWVKAKNAGGASAFSSPDSGRRQLPPCNVSTPMLNVPASGRVGQQLTFVASGSACSNGHTVGYEFDWGDYDVIIMIIMPGPTQQSHVFNEPGTYPVRVRAICSGYVTSPWSFPLNVVIAPPQPAPTVTSLNPTHGPAAGGNSVIITGTNFTNVTGVKFGTVNATPYNVDSATQITATAPAGTAGSTVDVSVTTSAGTSANTTADDYTYDGIQGPVTHTSTGYTSGQKCIVQCRIEYNGTPESLGWQATIPQGWSFVSDTSTAGIKPQSGDPLELGWAWFDIPSSPIVFSYELSVPSSCTSPQNISAVAIINGIETVATPNPLVVQKTEQWHSADYNSDWKINLTELLRVIQLYNYRVSNVRTGEYHIDATTVDGFQTGPGTLSGYHSADYGHDGKINLTELLRVIQHYNYRADNVRTGQYHIAQGTVDGFAPGPESTRGGVLRNDNVVASYTEPVPTSYVPGDTVTINCRIEYNDIPGSLGWEATIPQGWSFVSDTTTTAGVTPQLGDGGELAWAWINIPASPITFSYTLQVSNDSIGEAVIESKAQADGTDYPIANLTMNPEGQTMFAVSIGFNSCFIVGGETQFPAGATVTMEAVVPAGSVLDGWSADPDDAIDQFNPVQNNLLQTTFVMPAKEVTVTANYRATIATLTMAVIGNGTVTPAQGGKVLLNVAQNITAVADANCHFVNWTANGGATVADPNAADTTVTLTADGTVTAHFVENGKYPVTVERGTGDGDYYAGEAVNITADAAGAGQEFTGWTSDDGVVFANAAAPSTTFVMPAKGVTVTANYRVTVATLTMVVVGNGIVTPAPGTHDVPLNVPRNITADADANWHFVNWTANGGATVADANDATTTATLTANGTVTANFAEDVKYPVTVESGSGDGDYYAGATVNITADAAPAGQEFAGWTSADGVAFANATAASTTFEMPAKAVTVTANYQPITYTVTLVPRRGELVDETGWVFANSQYTRTFESALAEVIVFPNVTPTEPANWVFDHWTVTAYNGTDAAFAPGQIVAQLPLGFTGNIKLEASFQWIGPNPTPWYPVYDLGCTEHAVHQVNIYRGDELVAGLVVRGVLVKPVDYLSAGCPGLLSGVDYTFEVSKWNSDELCHDPEIVTPEYQLPETGTVAAGQPDADNVVPLDIDLPMAGKYRLTIYKGAEVYFPATEFVFAAANEEGFILPNAVRPIEFFSDGTYDVEVLALNPLGEAVQAATCQVVIEQPAAPVTSWPVDGFTPAEGQNILLSGVLAQVLFSWPAIVQAAVYDLLVYDSNGNNVAAQRDLLDCHATVTLSAGVYFWRVVAVSADGQEMSSPGQNFAVIARNNAPIISRAAAAENPNAVVLFCDPATSNYNGVSYEIQFYTPASGWIEFMGNARKAAVFSDADQDGIFDCELDLGVPVSGGYLLIRTLVNGQAASDAFTLFRIP